jgi:hypothetical protein
VEKSGLVLPSLKDPHSGRPFPPQPRGSRARDRTSPQPSGFAGQPSASAIGFGIAITSGVCAIDGVSAGTRSPLSWAAVRCRSSAVQDDDAGLHTSGRGPSTRSSQPRASASVAPPDAFEVTWTSTQVPSTWRSDRL